MSKKLVEYLLLIALLALVGGAALAQSQPAEAKLDKYPPEARMDSGETRCGDYMVFHDGIANHSGVEKVSYFFFDNAVSKYFMPPLAKIEVVVSDRAVPTVQHFSEDGVLKKVILQISQSDLDKATCFKKKAEKPK